MNDREKTDPPARTRVVITDVEMHFGDVVTVVFQITCAVLLVWGVLGFLLWMVWAVLFR